MNTFIRYFVFILFITSIVLVLYNDLLAYDLLEKTRILLEGGEYIEKGEMRKCAGLQLALSYFVYAKMSMSDGGILTRTGLMQHNDSYASRVDDRNRVRRYDEVMNVAEAYLASSLAYLESSLERKGSARKRVRGTRLRIHAIGE